MGPLAILGGIQAIGGGIQAYLGGRQARKANSALEQLKTPTTTSSASIADYYNRASASPYSSAMYQNQAQNIGRGTVQGLGMLQDRRGGLSGISGLIRTQNDALLRAGSQAEQQQMSRLGYATQMKASDDQRVFGINKMLPYEKQYSLLASKAAAGNQIANAGLQNIFGGLGTAAMGMSGQQGNEGGGGGYEKSMYGRAPNVGLGGMGYSSPASGYGSISGQSWRF